MPPRPPRLNKRQLREQEELEQLAAQQPQPALETPAAESSDDDEAAPAALSLASHANENASVFAALNLGQDEPEDDDDEEELEEVLTKAKKSKSKKKKKKGPLATPSTDGATGTPTSNSTTNPGTPSKKLASSAATKPDKSADAEMDEIDRALAEIASKSAGGGRKGKAGGEAATPTTPGGGTSTIDPMWMKVKEVFSFDPKFLDADAELRRMFGSKVINTGPAAPRSGHHARFANNPHHSTSLRRAPSFLAQPEPGWSPAAGILSLTRYPSPSPSSDPIGEWWTYTHSQQYREAQLGFLEVLQQADGNRLYDVLEGNPYHVDTHMQLSEMQVQQGDLGASSTHLSKALYALSAPLPTSFPNGTFRLPYHLIENRAFFTGIARKVAILVKRGTWRTACEWAKIALGAGGDADPVGMLVYIDFLAPKAKQHTWFLSLLSSLPPAYPSLRLSSYPGLAYAKALSLRGLEEESSTLDEGGKDGSTAALTSAILRFPMVVPLLLATLGGIVPPQLLSHRRAQVDGAFSDEPSYLLSLLSQLYAVRSSPLWKEPPILAWLQQTAKAAAPLLDDSTNEDVREGERLFLAGPWPKGYAPAGVIRAAYLAELPSIRPYLPPSATNGTSYSYDPLPPSRSDPNATFYDDTYLAPLYSSGPRSRRRAPGPGGGGGGGGGGLAGLRQQLMAMLEGGAGGGAGQEMDGDLREALMAQLEEMGRGGRGEGEFPGGFPGEEGEDDDGFEDEEEDGEEEDGQGAGGGMMERLMQYMRGGAAPP